MRKRKEEEMKEELNSFSEKCSVPAECYPTSLMQLQAHTHISTTLLKLTTCVCGCESGGEGERK